MAESPEAVLWYNLDVRVCELKVYEPPISNRYWCGKRKKNPLSTELSIIAQSI